ncbi:hypothetical protein SAMN05216203_3172 [Marinobacter daqiaonensis]|uniref:Uncharacterized protein n=1 Tax=Marinobacter daqiaonensis TaxID=650891 RepID=A0A1I6JQY5_9GAMM|nr:hypothetical protein SAMN05216203_3172 [Marinobacter daqiaonensis]
MDDLHRGVKGSKEVMESGLRDNPNTTEFLNWIAGQEAGAREMARTTLQQDVATAYGCDDLFRRGQSIGLPFSFLGLALTP